MFDLSIYAIWTNSSESNIVHLVSFNIPYPPDYGGVIDVFTRSQP